MQSFLYRFNTFFERAPLWLLPYRWFVVMFFLLLTGLFVYGTLHFFKMDMSLESWFRDDDPAKHSLDEFRKQFGSDDGVYVVYAPEDGDVFSAKSIKTLAAFHSALDDARIRFTEENPGPLTRIQRIDSLYNARYQKADGDTLIMKKLIASDYPDTDSQREHLRKIAQSQNNFELAYFSKDFRYGGIRLKTDFGVVPLALPLTGDEGDTGLDTEGETDFLSADDMLLGDELVVDESISVEEIEYADMQMAEYLDFMTALRAVADSPEFSEFRFYYTGNAPMMEFALNNMKQASVLLLFMIFIVVGLLWFLFRSLSAVVWPIVVIAGSAFWTIGAASWMGVTLSNMVTLTFMLILAVGIADCVHVLSSYIFFRHRHEHREAIQMAFRKTGLPIFLTTITTMAGMSALMVSDIPQIGVFGVTSAIGVGVAFILTILVFPVLLDVWHPKVREDTAQPVRKHAHWLQPLLNRIPGWVTKRAKTIVIVYLGIFLMFVIGAANVKVDSNFAELTKEGSEIRVTYSIVDESMMGGQNMEVLLQFGQRNALKDPVVLQAVDDFQRFIEAEYDHYVVKTFSLADFVKDTNKIMNGGNPTFERIPEDERLAAQLIYLFDNANPVDRRNLVADDYSKSHISIQLRNAGSYEYTQFFDEIKGDVKRFFNPLTDRYPEAQYSVTGSLALMMELIDHISWTQIKSFSFALLIITVLMMLTLGSVQAGLISMVPNLLPAFFTFGLMGLLGIPLDTDTLIIAPLIIGIAVDDTIHFVAHYRDAWFASGDVHQALESTIKEVGQAVTFTTLILGVGFSMLAFSDYLGLAKTGIFGSMAIFVALSSDLLLLPALIKWVKPDLGRKKYLASAAQVAI